jgi:uncharacterized protein (DUF1697 family)
MKKATKQQRLVALLRAINVGGNRKVPMAELRTLAEELGWEHVATYIQSGNLVFSAAATAADAEDSLERAIERHFGFAVPVIVRSAETWSGYAAGSPFGDAETERAKLLHLGLSKRPPKAGAVDGLLKYCTSGERVELRGDALWIDFPTGVARSKLTPTVVDRLIGSPVTMRNWNTVQELARMSGVAG